MQEQQHNKRRWSKSWIPLAVIVVVAGVLRYLGIGWGLPNELHLFSYHPDEFHSLRGVLSMLMGDMNPHFFNYGSLYLYLVGLTALLLQGGSFALASVDQVPHLIRTWTLVGREITLVMALLTVVAVYYLGREIISHRAGLIAAALCAVFPIHVLHSHYATVDVTQTFFITLCLVFAVRIYRSPNRLNYLVAGLAAGLAASTKYNGAAVIIAPVAAHFLRMLWAPSQKTDNRNLLWLLVAAPIAFFITSPYTVLDWHNARSDIAYEIEHMRMGEEPARSADPSGALFHLRNLTMTTLGAPLLALIGAVCLLRRRELRGPAAVIAIFAVAWFMIIAGANVRYMRYELPLVPAIAVLAPAALLALWRRRPEPKLVGIILLAAVLLGSAYVSIQMDRELMDVDPRDEMFFVVDQTVPVQAEVGMIWEPWFQSPPLDYVNGGTVLRGNPTWQAFSRQLRQFAVIGMSGEDLRKVRPFAVVYSNFEIRDALRVGQPSAETFVAALENEYEQIWTYETQAPLAGTLGWTPPQDWLYPFPTLHLWIRDFSGASNVTGE
ncbi:MAG: glycosyltransferase family 39 protein [Armatimonadota bacterium]